MNLRDLAPPTALGQFVLGAVLFLLIICLLGSAAPKQEACQMAFIEAQSMENSQKPTLHRIGDQVVFVQHYIVAEGDPEMYSDIQNPESYPKILICNR